MSYKRVRPRNSKRNRPKLIGQNSHCDACPIPSSELKNFVEQNPNASESAQIEAFFGEPMIPVFYENEPNLINTCPQKMAEYKRQRQLVERIKNVKHQKKKHQDEPFVDNHSFSQPFFTVLIKIMSNRKPSEVEIKNNLQHLGAIEDIVAFNDGTDYPMAFVRFESNDVAFDFYHTSDRIKLNYGSVKNVGIKAFAKPFLCCDDGFQFCAFMRPIDKQFVAESVKTSLPYGYHFDVMEDNLLLTETDRRNRLNLCQKLEHILNNNGLKCRFHVFGSTVNELGFCNSDIDIFIEFFDENNLTNKMSPNLAVKYLIEIRQLLRKQLRMYIRPTIQSRRCPLLKLDFRQFGDSLRSNGISCDLSCVNSLGINNSKLIAFYSKLEPPFHTLAVVLRYLAKVNGFIGSSQMSSYAFSMLIIFFCQSLSVPLLPTVEELMEMKTQSVIMNGWECGFCDDVNHYRKSFPKEWNETSINYLFQLFFQFYCNFDFRTKVICPRNGRTVLKAKFDNYLANRGLTNVHEFQMTELICIQDPFDLTFNMTHHMPYKLFLGLRAWFRKVSAYCHQYFNDYYPHNCDPNTRTFMDLLEPTFESIEDIKKQLEKESPKTIEDNTVVQQEDDIQITERVISKHFVAKLSTDFGQNVTTEEIETHLEDWSLKVSHFFRMLFREGFTMKCIYDSKPKSKIKFNETTTFETYVIKFNTIDRRIIDKNVRQLAENQMKEQSLPLDFINRQTVITNAIIDNSEHCLIIDDNSEEIRINLELSFQSDNKIFLNVTEIKPRIDSQLTTNLIDFICQTLRSGLESEQLLSIDDDIVFL